ncbi:peptide methionine sulfoxide reductase-like [Crassostrea virginica]|uniref:peptide-methionine (S)-S-oxide reductase n=1 Tax=Crassostrea virginica TaxID=6565 RepID=A0A8B8EG18_CRAVI|nr:peptide methionine sulfoxide reductase-like [Crassostrea virginica]XP_022344560.1 peptide methionine sulfoxide reductase-like [Crassostrea virginica]
MRTRVGFTGGTTENPTYRTIGDHTETVDLEFDPNVVSYEELLNKFWKSHNPCSQRGTQYMSAIFYHSTKQKMLAEQTKDEHQKNHVSPIITKITQAGPFYNAENYHQKYILRQHRDILDSLNLSDEDIISSPLACKLNGYLGGYGNYADFLKDTENMELTSKQLRYVEQQLKKVSKF